MRGEILKQHSNLLVFDATPLIYLAKTHLLEKIKIFDTTNVLLESIYTEVVDTGKKNGYSDALYIQKLIERNLFIIKKCSPQLPAFQENKNLSPVDRDVLTFAKMNDGMLITDDEEARLVAEIEGIEVHGSVYILFRLLSKKMINKNNLKNALDTMIHEGWHCSIDFYNEIVRSLDKV